MTTTNTWTFLIYTCGDAAGRLAQAAPAGDIDLATLLNQPPGAFANANATVILQGHNMQTGQAVRLVQEPGQSRAHPVAWLDGVQDSPAARDEFIHWAMSAYPGKRTLLFLADCKARPEELYPLPGTAFELVESPDGPDMRPLNEEALNEINDQAAGRGALGGFLGNLLAALIGKKQPESGPSAAPKPVPTTEDSPMQPERDWTILLYMAGDNGKLFQTKYGAYSLMAEMT